MIRDLSTLPYPANSDYARDDREVDLMLKTMESRAREREARQRLINEMAAAAGARIPMWK